jgi:hypothetical protein
MTVSEAVEQYLEIMDLPEGRADAIYNRALRTVADDVLPPLAARPDTRVQQPASAAPVPDVEHGGPRDE